AVSAKMNFVEKKPVRFSWQTKGKSSSTVLTIASQNNFAKPILRNTITAGKNFADVTLLAAGNYFWKLSSAEGRESPAQMFTLVESERAIPIFPKDKMQIVSPNAENPLAMRWHSVGESSEY